MKPSHFDKAVVSIDFSVPVADGAAAVSLQTVSAAAL